MASRGSQTALTLLDKMGSPDADFRYMALNDLTAHIVKHRGSSSEPNAFDERTEGNVTQKTLDLVKDTNGEVKNMAVKCLGALFPTIRPKQMQVVLDKLIEYLGSKDEELHDIASLGLKTVMVEIPAGSALAASASGRLVPKLLEQVGQANAPQEHVIDSLDVLSDYFTRFASSVGGDVQLQKNALSVLTKSMNNNRAAIRKRAVMALSALAASATSEVFTTLSESVAASTPSSKAETTKTYIQLLGALSKTCPRRIGRRLPEFMPRILSITGSDAAQEDDELREACLQALESIILRCPAESTPFILPTIEAAAELLRYDPNYAGGDSDDDMTDDMDGLDDDEDLLGDEAYSDDEDLSWKVRRASAKLLAVICSTRSELLAHLASNVAPALVSRFSEREESVRNEVMTTFTILLQRIRLHGAQAQATEVMRQSPGALKRKWDGAEAESPGDLDTLAQIKTLVPAIAKALSKEAASKSTSTRLSCYIVLQELVQTLQGGLDEQLGLLIGQMSQSTKGTDVSSSSAANLKAEMLGFLRLVFLYHQPAAFAKHLDQVVSFIVSALSDKVHRDAVEGFRVVSALVAVLRPIGSSSTAQYAPFFVALFGAMTGRLTRADSDSDIKEGGIVALGDVLVHAGDDLAAQLAEACSLLLERIKNEVTRLAAVRVAGQIAVAPTCQTGVVREFAQAALPEVISYLRKNNRLLRSAAFECLSNLVRCLGTALPDELAMQIIQEIDPLLAHESNLSLVPAALQSLQCVLASGKALGALNQVIVPRIQVIVQSPLLQGAPLLSVIAFIQAFLQASPAASEAFVSILDGARRASASSPAAYHVYSTVAQCVGAVVVSAPDTRNGFVDQAKQALPSSGDEGDLFYHLRVLGEIGRVHDFGGDADLVTSIAGFYTNQAEQVRTAAAFSLGNMAVGNLQAFLPVLEKQLQDEKQCRLALVATKELITHGSPEQLDVVAQRVWTPLFDICATKDETVRNVGAECLARLTVTQPERYLPQLQSRIHDPAATTRATVISAIRYTLTDTSPKYDELLAPSIVDFLSLLKDDSLDVRKPAMFAFNAATHNRPALIRDHLDVLLPMLYRETVPRPELLRKVPMGPFTVTTDDGLDLRKNAFETMFGLLDTAFTRLNLNDYIERVIAGLKDDDGIKVLSSLMLVRLAALAGSAIGTRLDDIVEPIMSTLKVKLKDQATKQDVERSNELQRSLFRAMVALDKTPHTAPKFEALKRDARQGSPLYREVESSFESGQHSAT